MNLTLKKYISPFLITILAIQHSFAHNDNDFLRSTGKIYSVIAAIVIIFIGIATYLWRLDRKITKLEKHIDDEHKTS